MRGMGGATSASPAHAQRTWQRWKPPPTWECPGAGRSESMMPRCAWGAAPIQVRGPSGRLRAVGGGWVWPREGQAERAGRATGSGGRSQGLLSAPSSPASLLGREGHPAVACAPQGHLGGRCSVRPISPFCRDYGLFDHLGIYVAGRRETPRGPSGPDTAEEGGSTRGASTRLVGTVGLAAELCGTGRVSQTLLKLYCLETEGGMSSC